MNVPLIVADLFRDQAAFELECIDQMCCSGCIPGLQFSRTGSARPSPDCDRVPQHLQAGPEVGIDRFRWVEYSFSATLMVLLISVYSGITSINGAVANVAMILFGWIQWISFW